LFSASLEQRDVHRRRGQNPRNLPLSLALGTGVVIASTSAAILFYLSALRCGAAPLEPRFLERGIQYALKTGRHGTMTQMFGAAGGALMATPS